MKNQGFVELKNKTIKNHKGDVYDVESVVVFTKALLVTDCVHLFHTCLKSTLSASIVFSKDPNVLVTLRD